MSKASNGARTPRPVTVRSAPKRTQKSNGSRQTKRNGNGGAATQARARGDERPLQYGDDAPRTAVSVSDSAARGKYVYCIIRSAKPLQFGLSTIAGEVGGVHTVNWDQRRRVGCAVGPLDSTREKRAGARARQ